MEPRRRRTDQLPDPRQLSQVPLERAGELGELVVGTDFEQAVVVHVPDDGSPPSLCAGAGSRARAPELLAAIALGCARSGHAMRMSRDPLDGMRRAAMPVGRMARGTLILLVSDRRMTQREAQSLAVWAAPAEPGGMQVRGGKAAGTLRSVGGELHADVMGLALFAQSGLMLQLHVRSGALLHAMRVPADTVWGEAARHQAAFHIGELGQHPGAELLASVGMRFAALVGLENGHGISVGSIGVASRADLDLDVSHRLLGRAPRLGPELMQLLSSTRVPVPDENGSVDLVLLAARVGCHRFAMYERLGDAMRLVAAHTADGTRLMTPPDVLEQQLVGWAIERRIGVVSDTAAAILIGEDVVLYAQDPDRSALERLRMALHDLQRNPFGATADEAA